MKKLFVAALTAVAFAVAGPALANEDNKSLLPGGFGTEEVVAVVFAVGVGLTIASGSSTPVIDTETKPVCKDGEELVNGVCVPTTTITVTNSVTTTLPVTATVTTTGVN